MKIVVFGASGQTGKLLINKALQLGNEVVAYVRRENSIDEINDNLRVIVGELKESDKMESALAGADVCISTLGGNSLSKHAVEFTDGIDRIVALAEKSGVKRMIYLSSIGAGNSRFLMGPLLRFIVVGLLLRIPLWFSPL